MLFRSYIQTRMPNAQVIKALVAGDAERFYSAETESRRRANAPPFGRFAAIIISSENGNDAAEAARLIGKSAPHVPEMHVYGPAPAPMAVLRGRHRHRILIHASRQVDVQGIIHEWLARLAIKNSVRVTIDIDPYSFM